MKKKILFVDDESLVLEGLQRMLRPLREEWEMEFVDSGLKALERIALSPFDAVVSDMRMPGMTGAELLDRVMASHPKTLRLILSGHADKELVFKCVGSTHQFLAKPCGAEELKATILRASSSEYTMEDETLKRLVSQMHHLPSIPSLYLEIIEAMRDPVVSIDKIGTIIQQDIAMTAQILKLVNSAYFGLRRQVSNPVEAVNYLGLDTIRSLILSVNAFSQFDSVKVEGFSIAKLWPHSLDTGTGAKLIAKMEGSERNLCEESFVAGLLHDAGKLILAVNFAEQYREVVKLMQAAGLHSYQAEQQVFGVSHAEVGGFLFGLWGLPVPVVEAITLHHRPVDTHHKLFSPLTTVHAANVLVQFANPKANPLSTTQFHFGYLSALGLADRTEAWREGLEKITSTTSSSL